MFDTRHSTLAPAPAGLVSGVVVRNVKLDEVTTPIQLYQTNLGHP